MSLTDKGIPTSLQASNRGLSLDLRYIDHGAIISDRGFLQVVVNLLIFTAQLDPKNEPSVTLRAYNDHEDYTLSIGPTSAAASDRLPWGLLITALGYLPSEMLGEGPGGRWAELTGSIRFDGAIIGKIQILRGQFTPSTLGFCETTAVDSRNGTIEDGSGVNIS